MSTSAKEIAEEAAALVGVTLDRCDFSHRRLTEILLPFIERAASCASGDVAERATVTERDAVLRERKAFVNGCCMRGLAMRYTENEAASLARDEYELPKIVRPRVVEHDGYQWRVVNGGIQWDYLPSCSAVGTWRIFADMQFGRGAFSRPITDAHARMWADLLANPTEVDADAGVSL